MKCCLVIENLSTQGPATKSSREEKIYRMQWICRHMNNGAFSLSEVVTVLPTGVPI